MKLNSLPDLCLLNLFEIFPIKFQAHLQAVCTRWKWLIERRIWSKVRQFRIDWAFGIPPDLINNFRYIVVGRTEVHMEEESLGMIRFVCKEHFPNVTSLDMFFNTGKQSPSKSLMTHCLSVWTDTLTHLWLSFPPEKSKEYQSATWTQIDSMKSLQLLFIHFPRLRAEEDGAWTVPKNVSILSKLKKFMYYDRKNDGIGALTQLGPSLQVLSFDLMPEGAQILKSIVPKLTSLDDLSLSIAKFPEPYLVDLLTSLVQLSRLSDIRFRSVDWDQFISLITHHDDYPKLTSVKHFSMDMVNTTEPDNPHQHMDQFNRHFFSCIPVMFPSLKTIEVEMYGKPEDKKCDKINVKMKRKFAGLREVKFVLNPYVIEEEFN